MKPSPQVLKGMRDFLPPRMILRHYVTDVLRRVFERHGFEPLQTPTIEYAETFRGKIGEEANKLMYTFEDRGGREVGLRYDLTVPLARVVAMYPDLVKPFKRYQIAPVWRAERPQKGRYREFYQCDVDIVGTSSMLADAEVVTIAYQSLRELGFTDFRILMNNRKILQGISELVRLEAEMAAASWRVVDKWDKIGAEGVQEELAVAGVDSETTRKLFNLLDLSGTSTEVLRTLKDRLNGVGPASHGVTELQEVVRYLDFAGVPERYYQVDLHMVRGLDYYTGPIFEIVVDRPKIGSLSGGGRYDNLIGMLGGGDSPAVGISLGLERLIDVIDELGMAPPEVGSTVTDVLVTVFDAERLADSLATAASLRTAGVRCEVFLGDEKLGHQIRYANRKNIPLVVIIGPDEANQGTAILRAMTSGSQRQVDRGALLGTIQTELATVVGLVPSS
jgi:histidyl-tRNA synthetase